jgi:putative NADH-flavin reductase
MPTRSVIGILIALLLSACITKGSYQGIPFTESTPGDPAPQLSDNTTPQALLIIGGTSGVGFELTHLALARGHYVWALSRDPSKVTLTHPNLSLVAGDILKPETIAPLLDGKNAVVSAIGLPAGASNVSLFSRGMSNLIPLMEQTKVQRLISVSAIGVGNSKGHGGFFFDNLLAPWILEDDLLDKERAEHIIQKSSLNYSIIRPAILTDDPSSQKYRVLTDLTNVKTGYISRADVAHLILALIEQQLYVNQTISISN